MYPMKVEKKKAREELDVVNVIEWRRSPADARWFLLVRRPEGGEWVSCGSWRNALRVLSKSWSVEGGDQPPGRVPYRRSRRTDHE